MHFSTGHNEHLTVTSVYMVDLTRYLYDVRMA